MLLVRIIYLFFLFFPFFFSLSIYSAYICDFSCICVCLFAKYMCVHMRLQYLHIYNVVYMYMHVGYLCLALSLTEMIFTMYM